MAIELRDVTPEDEAFLREVYACTREAELAMVPWTPEQREAFLRFQFDAQHAHYHKQYPEASYQIILNHGEAVGRLYVLRNADEIKILDITVLPKHRTSGIGSSLLGDLLAEADAACKPVLIWVEQTNPSQSLFKNLGFSKIQDDGYQDLMERRPPVEHAAVDVSGIE
jgi:ribosomal protein S18 acetylase RimI-like enzyme